MFGLMLIGVFVALVVGLLIKFGTDYTKITSGKITWIEFAIGALLCMLVLVPSTTYIGYKVAQAQALKFNEYWSGYENGYHVTDTSCTRDGSCHHHYECDVYYTYTYETTYSGTGSKRHATGTRRVSHRHSHQCPYTTDEYTYTVTNTLGSTITLGDHWYPANPQEHRYRWGVSVPGGNSGVPAAWTAAKDRIDSGEPNGSTEVHTYDNYILASQDKLLAHYSDAVDKYRKAGVLPDPSHGIYNGDQANKVYFVGTAPSDAQAWQIAMMRFDGALGTLRQGDGHLVIVNSPKVTNPDEYTSALQARWQARALGDNALSKNGLVIVLGTTDGSTVAWARAFTGMPQGNENIAQYATELKGTPLSIAGVLGNPKVQFYDGGKAAIVPGTGAVSKLVLGKPGFVRVSMHGGGKNGVGYKYLLDEVQPSGTGKFFIVFISVILAIGVWVLFLVIGEKRTPASGDNDRDDFRPGGPARRRPMAFGTRPFDTTHFNGNPFNRPASPLQRRMQRSNQKRLNRSGWPF